MAEVTTVATKKVTLTNSIYVDGVKVMIQTYSIDSTSGVLGRSEPIIDQGLYKENRVAIREIMAEFEDEAYEEQDEVLSAANHEDIIEDTGDSDGEEDDEEDDGSDDGDAAGGIIATPEN